VRCPYCRYKWVDGDKDRVRVVKYPMMDITAFSIFAEWTLHEHIAVEDDEDGRLD
jgi:hypothetical protein